MNKKPFDEFCEKLDKDMAYADIHLDNAARKVEKIDNQIEIYEMYIKREEKKKQVELSKFRDVLELAVKNDHTLPNGYRITYDNKRKIEIQNVGDFLRWMKNNCETSEVLEFFTDALKSTSIKKFVERKCDEQRANGIMEPKIDGIDLGQITFTRLTTFPKGKK